MDNINFKEYPLLGDPKQMFEGENIYVIQEKAEIGKTYSFICPQCHTHFTSCTLDNEVKQQKCPECDTYIYFSSNGKDGRMRTRVASNNNSRKFANSGILTWTEHDQKHQYQLTGGSVTIGRADFAEPSDISIDDEMASRHSVEITAVKGETSGKFSFKLSVLRTTNPVLVNQNSLYSGSTIYLNYGDTIKIGETLFTLLPKE